jgi:hypothetical protein
MWDEGTKALQADYAARRRMGDPETVEEFLAIQKGLAFGCEQSGTVTVPGTKRAPGSCPAGCMAEVGPWWWRRTMPHHCNGGSRCQDSPIRSSGSARMSARSSRYTTKLC